MLSCWISRSPNRKDCLVRKVIAFVLCALCFVVCASAQVDPTSPIARQLQAAEDALARIVQVPDGQRTFANTVGALDDLITHLQTDIGMVAFMAHVSTDAQERDEGLRAQEE